MFVKEWSYHLSSSSAYRNSWPRRATLVLFAVFTVCASYEALSQDVVSGKSTESVVAEIDSAVLEMADLIDQQIDAGSSLGGEETRHLDRDQLCGDEEFLRRAYLDLVGVNPEPRLVIDYLNDGGTEKRRRAVHDLVQSPMFSIRLADQWTDLLLAEDANVPELSCSESPCVGGYIENSRTMFVTTELWPSCLYLREMGKSSRRRSSRLLRSSRRSWLRKLAEYSWV